jgi:hypothetical protein
MRSLDQIIKILVPPTQDDRKKLCDNVDACVEAWRSLLPKSKQKLVGEDGDVDLLLWRGHCLISV